MKTSHMFLLWIILLVVCCFLSPPPKVPTSFEELKQSLTMIILVITLMQAYFLAERMEVIEKKIDNLSKGMKNNETNN